MRRITSLTTILAGFVAVTLSLVGTLGAQVATVPPMSVEGLVRGPMGEAMRGIRVRLLSFHDDKLIRDVATDGDGMFVIGGLAANRYYKVEATAPGMTRSRRGVGLARLNAGTRVRARLRLFAARTLEGVIHDDAGAAIADVRVTVALFERTRIFELVKPATRTNIRGEFVLAGVPHGDIPLLVWAPGFRVRSVPSGEFGKPCRLERAFGPVLQFPKIAAPAGVAVEMSVRRRLRRRARQAPARDPFRAGIAPGRLRLDAQGRCRLPFGLPDGDWELHATIPGYTVYAVRIAIPAPEGTVVSLHCEARATPSLQPALPLEGLLVDERGRPLPGVAVLIESGFTMASHRDLLTTDAAGKFVLRDRLVDGQAFRIALLSGGLVPTSASLDEHWRLNGPAVHGKLAKGQVFRLRTVLGTQLSGRITGVKGRDLGGQRVDVLFDDKEGFVDANAVVSTTTLLDGTFVLPAVPAAGVGVTVRVGGTRAWGHIDLGEANGERTMADLVIKTSASGRVLGRVVDATGKPVAGEVVTLMHETDGNQSVHIVSGNTLSDGAGRFCFADLAPGVHLIQAGGSGVFGPQSSRVEVVSGKTTRVEATR